MNLKGVGCDDIRVQSKCSAASKSSWEQTTATQLCHQACRTPGAAGRGFTNSGGDLLSAGHRGLCVTKGLLTHPLGLPRLGSY